MDWGGAGYQESSRLYRLHWRSDQGEFVVPFYMPILRKHYQVMSYIAVVFRHPHEQFRQYAELIPGITVRLLQDCPAEASSTRKVGRDVFIEIPSGVPTMPPRISLSQCGISYMTTFARFSFSNWMLYSTKESSWEMVLQVMKD